MKVKWKQEADKREGGDGDSRDKRDFSDIGFSLTVSTGKWDFLCLWRWMFHLSFIWRELFQKGGTSMPAVLSLDFICFWCVSALRERCPFMVIKKTELMKRKISNVMKKWWQHVSIGTNHMADKMLEFNAASDLNEGGGGSESSVISRDKLAAGLWRKRRLQNTWSDEVQVVGRRHLWFCHYLQWYPERKSTMVFKLV